MHSTDSGGLTCQISDSPRRVCWLFTQLSGFFHEVILYVSLPSEMCSTFCFTAEPARLCVLSKGTPLVTALKVLHDGAFTL